MQTSVGTGSFERDSVDSSRNRSARGCSRLRVLALWSRRFRHLLNPSPWCLLTHAQRVKDVPCQRSAPTRADGMRLILHSSCCTSGACSSRDRRRDRGQLLVGIRDERERRHGEYRPTRKRDDDFRVGPPLPAMRRARHPVPIVYGYPYGDMVAASFSGKIVLGGCIVEADSPTYRCPRCGREWAEAGGPRVEGAAAITFGRDTLAPRSAHPCRSSTGWPAASGATKSAMPSACRTNSGRHARPSPWYSVREARTANRPAPGATTAP